MTLRAERVAIGPTHERHGPAGIAWSHSFAPRAFRAFHLHPLDVWVTIADLRLLTSLRRLRDRSSSRRPGSSGVQPMGATC